MNKSKPKIIVILGPTASGKSALAIKLAKDFEGEIISADSRQVFKGMDIGTGKIAGFLDKKIGAVISEKVPHYAIDIANPKKDFNVSDFKKYTDKTIRDILKRGKLPIICGGTGFWIKAIVDNVDFPEVMPNAELRKKLAQKNADELFEKLRKLDPERAKNIDAKNKIRLVRAIEICNALGSVPKPEAQNQKPSPYKFLQIGIETEKDLLDKKIKKRLDERFAQGMAEEVENLHRQGLSWERMEAFGLEYRWIARYLQGKISLIEMKERLCFEIIHYAKRQMTWFRKDKRIFWIKNYAEAKNEIKKFLK